MPPAITVHLTFHLGSFVAVSICTDITMVVFIIAMKSWTEVRSQRFENVVHISVTETLVNMWLSM